MATDRHSGHQRNLHRLCDEIRQQHSTSFYHLLSHDCHDRAFYFHFRSRTQNQFYYFSCSRYLRPSSLPLMKTIIFLLFVILFTEVHERFVIKDDL